MRRILATAALLMTLAACSDAAGNGIATAGGKGSKTTAAAASAGEEKDGRKFAQCMRDHGVEMDDPDPNEPGRVEIRERKGERGKVQKAMEECRKYLPTPSKEDMKKDYEAMRKVAECMRANGIPEFPDPDPNGGGLSFGKDGGIDPESPKFKAAEEKCPMPGPPGLKVGPR